jgi:hypothetical protein
MERALSILKRMITALGESLKRSAHDDTPGHMTAFICKSLSTLGGS